MRHNNKNNNHILTDTLNGQVENYTKSKEDAEKGLSSL